MFNSWEKYFNEINANSGKFEKVNGLSHFIEARCNLEQRRNPKIKGTRKNHYNTPAGKLSVSKSKTQQQPFYLDSCRNEFSLRETSRALVALLSSFSFSLSVSAAAAALTRVPLQHSSASATQESGWQWSGEHASDYSLVNQLKPAEKFPRTFSFSPFASHKIALNR